MMTRLTWAVLAAIFTQNAIANPSTTPTTSQTLINNQEARHQALLEQLIPDPTIITNPTWAQEPSANLDVASDDGLCFKVNTITYGVLESKFINDAKALSFALLPEITGKHSKINHCFTTQDIQQLGTRVQNRLIERGFVTTRVLIGNQNLSEGKLVLTLVLGKIDKIIMNTQNSKTNVYVLQDDHPPTIHPKTQFLVNHSPAILSSALATQSGDLLNIRSLETTLENFKRVPSVNANFDISPSEQGLGMSNILINYEQNRRLQGSLSLDDSGSKATGKYQGTATLSIENPTSHNDLLYLSFGRDLGNNINKLSDYPDAKHSKNYAVGYVFPIKNTLFQLNASHYNYRQTVAGSTQDYIYGGESDNINTKISHLFYRDSHSKSHLSMEGYIKSQHSDIDGTEIDVQRRKIAGYEVGLNHETRLGKATNHTLNTYIGYQRGTAAFGAIPSIEEKFNEGTAKAGIYKLDIQLNSQYTPTFFTKKIPMLHTSQLKAQYATDSLTPNLKMAIGGRYTVRGFDGERSLSADNGILLKQDIIFYPSWLNPSKQNSKHSHGIYLGVDAGYVSNNDKTQNDLLLGQHLVGAAIGIKGQYTPNTNNPYFSFNYNLFASKALSQPNGFSDKDWVSGISLGMSY